MPNESKDVTPLERAIVRATIHACSRAEFGEFGGSHHDWALPSVASIVRRARVLVNGARTDAIDDEGWLPIATIPRDGTNVLCVIIDGRTSFIIIGYRDAWMDEVEAGGSPRATLRVDQQGPDGYQHEATHWMPLPALPDA